MSTSDFQSVKHKSREVYAASEEGGEAFVMVA